jgi:hypothetical protein
MATTTVRSEITGSSPDTERSFIRRSLRTWLRLVLFLAPVLVPTVLPVCLVDPYNLLFPKMSVVPQALKVRYSPAINDVLWKLPQYDKDPRENILLGDSQTERLRAEYIVKITGNSHYFNLAYGGGTLQESISSFWDAARRVKLQSVYFGISFMDYNSNPMDRVSDTEKLLHNRLQYLQNADAIQAALYEAIGLVPQWQVKMGPKLDRDAFWKYQLDYLSKRYHDIPYPSNLKRELQRIADYCRANHIEFVFVITPQSLDAQRRVGELGVIAEYERFKADLASIAPTIDCDIPSRITKDRANYSDPFHLTYPAAARVVEDIWSGRLRWCRVLGPGSPPQELSSGSLYRRN